MPPNYPQSIDKRSTISSITRNTCSTCHLGFKRRTQVSIVTVNRSRTTPGASPRSRLLCLLFRGATSDKWTSGFIQMGNLEWKMSDRCKSKSSLREMKLAVNRDNRSASGQADTLIFSFESSTTNYILKEDCRARTVSLSLSLYIAFQTKIVVSLLW